MADDDMLAHYSRALDEIFRLRQAAAFEAQTIYIALTYRSVPGKARDALEQARGRLTSSARGQNIYGHLSAEALDMALRGVGAPTTLTRAQWEAEVTE